MDGYLEYKNKRRFFFTFLVVLRVICFSMGVLIIFLGVGFVEEDFQFKMDIKSIIVSVVLFFVFIPVVHVFIAVYDSKYANYFNIQIGRQLTCQKYLVKSKDNRVVSYYNILNYFYWAPKDHYNFVIDTNHVYSIFYNLNNIKLEIDAARTIAKQNKNYDKTFIINILVSKMFIEDVIRINKIYRSRFKSIATLKRFFTWGRVVLFFFGQRYYDDIEQFDYECYRQVMVSRYGQFGLTPEILDFIHSERIKMS